MKLFFLLFFLIVSIGAMYGYKIYLIKNQIAAVKDPISHVTPYSLDIAPGNTLVGTIVEKRGDVLWQSRSASESSLLDTTIPILQGEDFWTNDNSAFHMQFPNTVLVEMQKNTHLAIIQALHDTMLFVQNSGTSIYTNDAAISLAVKSLHLLIQQEKGEMIVHFDTLGRIHIQVQKGKVRIAFNDTDVMSNLVEIEEGNEYIFDDDSKTGEITPL